MKAYRGEPVIFADRAPEDRKAELVVERLTLRFGGITAVGNVSMNVLTGELVSIIGPSGSGKSTLLNLMGTLDRPTTGDVLIDGQALAPLGDHERTRVRRDKIGFIFQFFNLLPTLSVLENVTLPLELNGTNPRQARPPAVALLEEVGLGDRLDTFPDRLSGGEQQRVAIARALVHDPQLVLADEPTGNLDETSGKQVLALLDRLTRQAGKNLLLVTHSREAASFADRVLVLREGKLEEQLPEQI